MGIIDQNYFFYASVCTKNDIQYFLVNNNPLYIIREITDISLHEGNVYFFLTLNIAYGLKNNRMNYNNIVSLDCISQSMNDFVLFHIFFHTSRITCSVMLEIFFLIGKVSRLQQLQINDDA